MSDHAIDVQRVAELARLVLEPAEVERFEVELGACLEYIAVLQQVDTDRVEPTSHPLPQVTPFRSDVASAALPLERALENAPATDGESFLVPRVVG